MQSIGTLRPLPLCAVAAGLVLLAAAGCSDDSNPISMNPPQTLQVNASGGGNFTTIAAAVASATPGSVIEVGPGTYSERIVLAQGMTLIGSGPATILSAPGTVQSFPDDSADDDLAVIEIRNTSNVTIQDVRISGPVDGIKIRNSNNVRLVNVTATGNGDDGVDIKGSRDISVSGEFSSNGDKGIQAREGSSGVEITNSLIGGNFDLGVRFRDSASCALRNSRVESNGDDGMEVLDSTAAAVIGNTILDNAGYGVRLRNSADTALEGNTIQGNVEGDVRNE